MGCSIHIMTEIKEGGVWKAIPDVPKSINTRDYHLFAFLSDVKNYFNTKSVEVKGLPDDISTLQYGFKSIKEHMKSRYENDGAFRLIKEDGSINSYYSEECKIEISEEEYNHLKKLQQESPDEFNKRYNVLGYLQKNNEPRIYSVQDATIVKGKYESIPFKKIYNSFEEFCENEYKDEYNEKAQDYGEWDINFEDESYHSFNHLSLKELMESDTESYYANAYKIDKEFYDVFCKLGGKMPDGIAVIGNTNPGDVIDAIRESVCPTVILSWQKTDEEKKKTPLYKGTEELKEIANKYRITNYEDIRIIFAFDN